MVRRIWLSARAGAFTWIVPERVGASRYPRDDAALGRLADHGIGLLVNLHEQAVPPERLARHGLRAVHLPVPDLRPPTVDQLTAGVAAIDAALLAGERVAVHCGAGLGRTGTLIAAWLVAQGSTVAAAVATVRERRPGSIETREQVLAIEGFASRSASRPVPSDPPPPGGPP